MNTKTKKRTVFFILFIIFIPALVSALSAKEIIKKLENNLIYKTSRSTGRIKITDRFGERVSSFISYTSGADKSMVEFTDKVEAGQKILRLKDEIYLYYPDAEELIRLQGAALKQNIIGSDMSYEDMAGDKSILDSYHVTLEGEEPIDGRSCYKIQLIAKKRNVPYQRQTMWIDKQYFIYKKILQLAKSGKVLKKLTVRAFKTIKDHRIPTDILILDMLKKNSSTEFYIDSFKLNTALPKDTFNLQGLW